MKSTQNLPVRLKELRKQNKYSQEYVAEQLNISRQAISHWENGKTYPDIDNLVLLAELYHISVDELLQNRIEVNGDSSDRIISIQRNDNALEILALLVILVLASYFPLGGIIVPIIITYWLKRTNRKYYIIYIVCALCFVLGIQEIFVVLEHILPYGRACFDPIK